MCNVLLSKVKNTLFSFREVFSSAARKQVTSNQMLNKTKNVSSKGTRTLC